MIRFDGCGSGLNPTLGVNSSIQNIYSQAMAIWLGNGYGFGGGPWLRGSWEGDGNLRGVMGYDCYEDGDGCGGGENCCEGDGYGCSDGCPDGDGYPKTPEDFIMPYIPLRLRIGDGKPLFSISNPGWVELKY